MSAPTGNALWVLVGIRLFRSSDRGETWTERNLPPAPAREVVFVDDREGWLAVPGSAATQCQEQSLSLWNSVDGGSSWQLIDARDIAPGHCKEHLSFADRLHGFFDAWDPNAAPVIYRTSDHGLSWTTSAPLPDPPGFTTRGAGFSLRPGTVRSFTSEMLVDATGTASGQPRRYIFASADGGATWAYRNVAPEPSAPVVFVSAARWVQFVGSGLSQETTDGGLSWHPYPSDYALVSSGTAEIVFGDGAIGYATVPGALQRTIDGGTHWTSLRPPGS